MIKTIKRSLFVTGYFYNRYLEDHCANRAAALAYTTLLSLVPMMMIGFSVLSVFPVFKGVGDNVQNFILTNFVAGSANIISKHLQSFLQQLRVLSWTNIISLAVVSILMIYNMVRAFNAIWHASLRRHLALSFVIYLVILLITPIIFGILLVLTSYLASLPLIAGTKLKAWFEQPLLVIMPYCVAFLTFTFFNWILPSCKVKLKHAAIAGLVTTIFFELAKYLFALYLSFFPTYRLIYGALATIPIFLVWLYVSWTIILGGALICNLLAKGIPKRAVSVKDGSR